MIGPYDANVMGAVTLFRDTKCSGTSARLYWVPWDLSNAGQYMQDDLELAGGLNDTISSLQVPKGYTAILYGDDGFVNEITRVKGEYEYD